jgi:hypothetical protein
MFRYEGACTCLIFGNQGVRVLETHDNDRLGCSTQLGRFAKGVAKWLACPEMLCLDSRCIPLFYTDMDYQSHGQPRSSGGCTRGGGQPFLHYAVTWASLCYLCQRMLSAHWTPLGRLFKYSDPLIPDGRTPGSICHATRWAWSSGCTP